MVDEEKAQNDKRRGSSRKPAPRLTEEQKKEDPFNFLGFGLVAYRDLMFIMFMLFAVLSLLMTPAMVFYSKYNAYTTPVGYSKLSLGNLGYSSS